MARKVDDGTSVVEVEAKITVKVVDRHLLIKPQKLTKKVRLGRVSLVHRHGAMTGGEAHGRSNVAKLQRMRQSKRAELHNRDFLMALGKTPLYNASVDAGLVEDFRLIETYDCTSVRTRCHTSVTPR